MKPPLVIDASVALKWFAEEDGHAEARTILASDESLIAPDLVVVESRELAARAALISVSLRHPVYDCLYLALAEDRDTVVITADRRLRKAVRKSAWAQHVRALLDRPDDEQSAECRAPDASGFKAWSCARGRSPLQIGAVNLILRIERTAAMPTRRTQGSSVLGDLDIGCKCAEIAPPDQSRGIWIWVKLGAG